MQSSTEQAVLQRLTTGYKCDARGCYDIAVWRVTFRSEVSHWCAKHTRKQMRDTSRWADGRIGELEA